MIRPALIAWRDATESLLAAAKQTADDQRDETIAIIESLLNKRDELQLEIAEPFTDAEKALGKQLGVMEAAVQKELTLFTNRIRIDISESKSKKDHVKTYVNPYGNVARDGIYYDTKQ
ncbi:hypothetical protein ACFSFY_02215 [Sporosarcina siberiensis]|uniref:Flagellar protein FliT n=1 Tax=Sporosarcina siberiensis TaxID=1365606 RepID=A0ABW4SDH7_9BACL